MAFAYSPTNPQDESTGSQSSEISGLSAFEMEITDTFDRRMAEQVHKQQLLRKAAGGQPLFGRHRNSASLRSAMGSLDRKEANLVQMEPKRRVTPQSRKTTDLSTHEPFQQWGSKSDSTVYALRRVLSSSNGEVWSQNDPTAETYRSNLSRGHFVNRAVKSTKLSSPTQPGTHRETDRTSDELYEDAEIVGQDSPESLRTERRSGFELQKRGKTGRLYNTKVTRSKSFESQPRQSNMLKILSTANGSPGSEAVLIGAHNGSGHNSSSRSSKILLKQLARAASLSPLAGFSTQAEQTAVSTKDGKMPKATVRNSSLDVHQDAGNVPGKYGAEALKTPKVTGGWVDTPVTMRRSSHAESIPLQNGLEPAVEHSGPQTYQKAQNIVESSENLKPLLHAEPEQMELFHPDPTSARLHVAHKGLHDTPRGKERAKSKVEVQRRTESKTTKDTAHIAPDLRLLTMFWNELASLPGYLFMERHDGRIRLTWLGVLASIIAAGIIGEKALCHYYCHPSHSYTMDGYGVNIAALRTPLVTISLVLGLTEWLWRPLVEVAYWIPCCLAGLPAFAGVAETTVSGNAINTDAPRETIIYDMKEWAPGSIGADEIL